jgi:hypothetical protein
LDNPFDSAASPLKGAASCIPNAQVTVCLRDFFQHARVALSVREQTQHRDKWQFCREQSNLFVFLVADSLPQARNLILVARKMALVCGEKDAEKRIGHRTIGSKALSCCQYYMFEEGL